MEPTFPCPVCSPVFATTCGRSDTVPGSWVRFDNVNFDSLKLKRAGGQQRRLSVRARVSAFNITTRVKSASGVWVVATKSYGATLRFQLGDPLQGVGKTLATAVIPARPCSAPPAPPIGPGMDSEFVVVTGSAGDRSEAPTGRATVFVVFDLVPGTSVVGGVLDWFLFELE